MKNENMNRRTFLGFLFKSLGVAVAGATLPVGKAEAWSHRHDAYPPRLSPRQARLLAYAEQRLFPFMDHRRVHHSETFGINLDGHDILTIDTNIPVMGPRGMDDVFRLYVVDEPGYGPAVSASGDYDPRIGRYVIARGEANSLRLLDECRDNLYSRPAPPPHRMPPAYRY